MSDPSSHGLSRRRFAQLAAAGALALGSTGVSPVFAAGGDEAFTRLRTRPLTIGCLVYDRMDQIDLTGPFSVLSRLPDATVRLLGATAGRVRDHKGFTITADGALTGGPALDLLLVPGGPGQEALMDVPSVLGFIRAHAEAGRPVFSVCTGALLCGAAGILRGRRATTHWSALELLPIFGAQALSQRVVVDGALVSAAGVTAGIDGALTVAALLRGEAVAQQIQLDIQYAPDPPFHAGTPEDAPADVLAEMRRRYAPLTAARRATAERVVARGLRTAG